MMMMVMRCPDFDGGDGKVLLCTPTLTTLPTQPKVPLEVSTRVTQTLKIGDDFGGGRGGGGGR